MRKTIATFLIAAALPSAALAANPADYQGRWILPCENGNFCRIYIEKGKQKNHFTFNFMTTKPENKPSDDCEWIVDMSYDGGGKLKAADPKGKYGFTVDLTGDGSLHASGTMPAKCGQRPTEATFQKDGSDDYTDE